MATALTEANLKALEDLNNQLDAKIKTWPQLLSDLESCLNDNTGKTFKDNYEKGKLACQNVQKIVDIFQSETREMTTLVKQVTEFIAAQRKANNS